MKAVKYGEKYNGNIGNVTIKCLINLNKKNIEFFKNGKSQGIAFKNIDDNIDWKFAVSLSTKGNTVTLINDN